MSNPFGPFQDLVSQLPELLQPLLIALVGAIPFIDEAASGLGVVAGVHPLASFTANIVGSTIAVILVVLLGTRMREALVARRARRSTVVVPESVPELVPVTSATGMPAEAPLSATLDEPRKPAVKEEESKGKRRLARWFTRFGVPGASLLGPLALPFSLTALFFVGAGVSKAWIILWQVIAIVLWTAIVTISATAATAAFAG